MQEWQKKELDSMVGKKFNRLTVVSVYAYDFRPGYSPNTKMNCVCECKSGTIVRANALRHNKTQSCGCLHKETARKVAEKKSGTIPIGTKFSIWAVIEFLRYQRMKGNIYLCKCSCGELKQMNYRKIAYLIRTGKRSRCLHGKYRDRSNKKVSSDIYFACLKFFDFQCVLCGSGEDPEIDHVNPLSNGGRGSAGNIVVLCRYHNRSKSDRTLDQIGPKTRPVLEKAAKDFERYWVTQG
jgi:5-methylcytosine-specific restriction endonuclease McrA